MIHLGDISKIDGACVPPVDVVIGGSPCQDLSVAGKRAGLDGARSGLFMEQIRIIKEMRLHSGATYPRYMVWENVPGAFSSNKGEDFRVVLEETARVADQAAVIPRPTNGKWTNAGCIVADGWSIAWRVLDAQFWGVPQRRRRIALVADFGGQSAPEILFEREGLRRDSAESGETREGAAANVEGSVRETVGLTNRGYVSGDAAETLRAQSHGAIPMVAEGRAEGEGCLTPWDSESKRIHSADTKAYQTLYASGGGKLHGVLVPTAYSFDSLASNSMKSKNPHSGCRAVDISKTLDTTDPNPSKNQGGIAIVNPTYRIQGNCIDRADTAGCNGKGWTEDVIYTLNTIDRPAVFDARGNGDGKTVPTLTGDHGNRVTDYTAVCLGNGQANMAENATTEVCQTLNCMHDQMAVMVSTYQNTGRGWWNESEIGATVRTPCGGDAMKANLVASVDCRNGTEDEETNGTLQAKPSGGMSLNLNNTVRTNASVRRLTPLECSRLQGYPDNWAHIPGWRNPTKEDIAWWTEVHYEWDKMQSKNPEKVKRKTERAIKRWLADPTSDSVEYKAYGNSIAIPPWTYVLQRLSTHCSDKPTMASLFDGIGGFPLIWEYFNGRGTCLWASEVDPFAIAVTKTYFGG